MPKEYSLAVKYERLLEDALQHHSGMQFEFHSSLARSILQTSMIASFELHRAWLLPDDDDFINQSISRMQMPSDGTIVAILDQLVARIRSGGWSDFCSGWFDSRVNNSGVEINRIVENVQDWVAFRNNRQGHGSLDQAIISEWKDKIRAMAQALISVLSDAIPIIDDDQATQFLETPWGQVQILTPLTVETAPAVYRKILKRRNEWLIELQRLDWEEAVQCRKVVPDDAPTALYEPTVGDRFRSTIVSDTDGDVTVASNLPTRQSAVFCGRESEEEELCEWLFSDVGHSNVCLVYGSGGVGKTTLVLEFLNRLLEGNYEGRGPVPELVSFYTAKQTRWTDQGIVHYSGVTGAVEDAIRELILWIENHLTREWYVKEGRELVDKVSNYLRDLGVRKDQILIVLDNTETLARRLEEEEGLVSTMREIARKVGRVLITSRRREKIEARPIDVSPMGDEEGAQVLYELACQYEAPALKQAGNARLRRCTRDVGGSPLLLDILARHISATHGSIEEAYNRVMQDSIEGLSEFLYEDAWRRIPEEHREVFLMLSQADIPIDDISLGYACRLGNVPQKDILESFEETHFGQKYDYGSNFEISLDDHAQNFFQNSIERLESSHKGRIRERAIQLEEFVKRAHEALQEYQGDRVSLAFKSLPAKFAKMSLQKGDIDEAYEWYQEAAKQDPYNGYLFDRIAWVVLHKMRDPNRAISWAKRAIELEPENQDAHFTLGLCYYQLNELDKGDQSINDAVKCGKEKASALIRMGAARYYVAKTESVVNKKKRLLRQAHTLVKSARDALTSDSPYFKKNTSECDRFESKIVSSLGRMNNQ